MCNKVLGLVIALIALMAPPAMAVEIGESAQGPIYYNRPGSSLIEHNTELDDCFHITTLRLQKLRVVAVNDKGSVTDVTWLWDLFWAGPQAGIEAVRVENCMLVRGWRAIRAPQEQASALSHASPAQLNDVIGSWVGAADPPGEVARTYQNEVLRPGTFTTASRPRIPSRDQLSLRLYAPTATTAPGLKLASLAEPEDLKKAIKPANIGQAPPGSGFIVVRVIGISGRYGNGVYFSREVPKASPSTQGTRPRETLGAAVGTMFAKKEGNWFILPVIPGRWRIEQAGFVSFCLGSPSFDVKPGEFIYAGTFQISGPTLRPDLDPTPANAYLAGSPGEGQVRPAIYRNGSRGPCDAFYVDSALEFLGVPFDPEYRWGGARALH